jgi:hypothetical protein
MFLPWQQPAPHLFNSCNAASHSWVALLSKDKPTLTTQLTRPCWDTTQHSHCHGVQCHVELRGNGTMVQETTDD